MGFPQRIETPRLILRKAVFPDDAALIHIAYASDPEVSRYDAWRTHQDIAETLRHVWATVDAWQRGASFSWVITERESGLLVGMTSLYLDGTDWRARLGYILAKSQWGRGYATEVARSMIDVAFTAPKLRRLWAVVDAENAASLRVLEKAGFEREGMLRRWSVHPGQGDEPRDCWCFAHLR